MATLHGRFSLPERQGRGGDRRRPRDRPDDHRGPAQRRGTGISRRESELRAAAEELTTLGEVRAVAADLASAGGRQVLVEAVGETEERLDVLVSNSGTTWDAEREQFPEPGWDKVPDLHLKAPFFLTRAFLPLLRARDRERDPARVLNVGTVDGIRAPQFENTPTARAGAACTC